MELNGTTRNFYPRSPCGERPYQQAENQVSQSISIHALLAESDAADISARREASISIHALLAESDWIHPAQPTANTISIHALLAESDVVGTIKFAAPVLFLSTLSLRRATLETICCWRCNGYFYPRSPCGERQPIQTNKWRYIPYFYPRSPCGERPLETICCWRCNGYFYPRSPCGERHVDR